MVYIIAFCGVVLAGYLVWKNNKNLVDTILAEVDKKIAAAIAAASKK